MNNISRCTRIIRVGGKFKLGKSSITPINPSTRSFWSFTSPKPPPTIPTPDNDKITTSALESTTDFTSNTSDTSNSSITDTLVDMTSSLNDTIAEQVLIPAMGWGPQYKVMYLIDYIHTFADLPYWQSIIAITIGLRVILIPIAIITQRSAARMARFKPGTLLHTTHHTPLCIVFVLYIDYACFIYI